MRFMILALMLSACSAYPVIDWPAGAKTAAAPALLPQSEIVRAGVISDPANALVARATGLRGWAAGLQH